MENLPDLHLKTMLYTGFPKLVSLEAGMGRQLEENKKENYAKTPIRIKPTLKLSPVEPPKQTEEETKAESRSHLIRSAIVLSVFAFIFLKFDTEA